MLKFTAKPIKYIFKVICDKNRKDKQLLNAKCFEFSRFSSQNIASLNIYYVNFAFRNNLKYTCFCIIIKTILRSLLYEKRNL